MSRIVLVWDGLPEEKLPQQTTLFLRREGSALSQLQPGWSSADSTLETGFVVFLLGCYLDAWGNLVGRPMLGGLRD